MRRVAALCVLLLAAGPALADTIVLKNGRRIRAAGVVEEGDRVSYETAAGRLSLPRSIVERVLRDDFAAEPALPPPAAPPRVASEGYDEVVRGAVGDGSIDREYLARLELRARSGDPGDLARLAVAHHAAAQFELERGQLDRAMAHYRATLTYAPEHPGALLHIAYLHLRRSEYTAALEHLERARRVAPDSPDAAKLAGWAHYGANRTEQAAAEWRRALELRPDPEVEQALAKAERDLEAERGFREGETRHFTLRYHGSAAPELARGILRALEAHFDALERALNFTPPERIGVILYTGETFADITRAPGWVGAVNDGRLRLPVQGLTGMTAELDRVLRHELVHSFLAQKTHNRCPVWLHEGVAQWMEGSRSGEFAQALVAAADRRGTLPLSALEGTWLNLSGQTAGFAYAWSLAVVEFVVETYGMRDLERLLDRVAAEPSTEAAFTGLLRLDYERLEAAAIEYLRRTYLP